MYTDVVRRQISNVTKNFFNTDQFCGFSALPSVEEGQPRLAAHHSPGSFGPYQDTKWRSLPFSGSILTPLAWLMPALSPPVRVREELPDDGDRRSAGPLDVDTAG